MATEPVQGNKNLNEEIIQWGCNYLASHRYRLKSTQPEHVQNTPWSYVVRFITSDGYIYLKHTPPLLALEPLITNILHDQFHASVPEVIAVNAELNCFLMKDAGRPLREILKKRFDPILLCKSIEQFTSIQLAVSSNVDNFLDIGVPDWRLDKLPVLYQQLLSQKDLLMEDGLSEIERNELESLLPTIIHLCKKLSNYSLKQTLVQCDFHDNNILISDLSQTITFIDLGEIVISHPFFSLVGCLRQAMFHHALTKEDDIYLRLLDACLKNYLAFESKSHLFDAFDIAQLLWFIYEALAQYRLRIACDEARFLSFQRQGKLSGRLKELMAACRAID
ncbi:MULTISPECIES: phosphotransferase [unclassified Legionella]|uniref:phosphotransferase n=1 Tax=unclassified Legionella TaxID=2622702 RepID=UPI001E532153|nr:phosphotransferase [Legionella sp. 31fI33]MCC5016045.1 aminoglycoside phosphotransferase family protein [Legionella sp. 31fI33]